MRSDLLIQMPPRARPQGGFTMNDPPRRDSVQTHHRLIHRKSDPNPVSLLPTRFHAAKESRQCPILPGGGGGGGWGLGGLCYPRASAPPSSGHRPSSFPAPTTADGGPSFVNEIGDQHHGGRSPPLYELRTEFVFFPWQMVDPILVHIFTHSFKGLGHTYIHTKCSIVPLSPGGLASRLLPPIYKESRM